MIYSTLISTDALEARLNEQGQVIADCRHYLDAPERGEQEYELAHIPGAIYVHLDRDLSSPVIPGTTGRHPLPEAEDVARHLSRIGIGDSLQVFVYDSSGGGIAARLWWMLKWLGHDAVAVLDGGWPRWTKENRPSRSGLESAPPALLTPRIRPDMTASSAEVRRVVETGSDRLLDARSEERYRGDEEPIDPVAGHIPGAISAPYADNLAADQTFLSPDQLRRRFEKLIGPSASSDLICYCGSGVTAAHNVLAFETAGLPRPKLYPGSWSEWITEPSNPVAIGKDE